MVGENGSDNGVKVPKGQINLNTVLGAVGTAGALGLAGNWFNGGNGSNYRNGNGGCDSDSYVRKGEFNYAQALNASEAKIAKLESEKYTDNNILEAYKATVQQFRASDDKIAGVVKETTQAFIETGKEVAVMQTKIACLETQIDGMNKTINSRIDAEVRFLEKDLHCCKKEMEGALALESERRACGDKNLYEYVNATFVPGKMVMPLDSICPQPMQRYNSWTAPAAETTPAS